VLWSERLHLEPLGDQAVLATFAEEAGAARFAAAVRQANPPWLMDVVLAYVTVAVFFDMDEANSESVTAALRQMRLPRSLAPGRLHLIPCCYERNLDLQRVAELTRLTADEVIRFHHSLEYTVFAIGFSPGFPYLGYLAEELSGVPRLDRPRVRVEPGSIGVAGRQTGIYPGATPGGWNLIGQTPLELVHLSDGYFPIRPGDRVRFRRIDDAEFRQLQGQRLLVD